MLSEQGDWTSARWRIPLSMPPVVVQMGVGIHGTIGAPRVERYRLPDLWCLHIYRYEAELDIDGRKFPIRPGYASVIPVDTPMAYRFLGRSEHLYCHFRCVAMRGSTEIPTMQDLGERFLPLYERFEEIILATTGSQERRQARLWDLLWTLTEIGATRNSDTDVISGRHPAVEKALRYIERRLSEPIRVAALAREADVSYSYLARLFQDAVGDNVVGYIRRRRVERAEHLLRHSTLPIKSIAVAVGVPDLHQFNKLIHRALGDSPRNIRHYE